MTSVRPGRIPIDSIGRDLIVKALRYNNLSTPRPNGPFGTGGRSRGP